MRLLRFLAPAMAVLCLGACARVLWASQPVLIVYGSEQGWIAKHAAEELASYIHKMTGVEARLSKDALLSGYSRVFLVGPPTRNRQVGALCERISIPAGECFVIRSFAKRKSRYTILAGGVGRASLYAVYDYLERFCKVGFFEDGEYVPKLSRLPFENANTRQKPHFQDRHYLVIFGHWGLKRFHPQFWTWEEWKRELDFLAKKKVNMSRLHMRCYWDTFRGDVALRAFPEMGPATPGYSTSGGWPNTYNWPDEYRTQLTKRILDYGRSLGIRFIYLIGYGDVPLRFKTAHPEIPFMPDDQYGQSTQIVPSHPMAAEVTKKYLRALIDTFGTDHLYFDTPYPEASPGADPSEKLQLKVEASKNLCRVLKEVDPAAIWVWDTWGFTVSKIVGNADVWTHENIKNYLQSCPMDMTYIFDNNADLADAYPDNRVNGKILPMYLQHDHFYGRRWAYAALQSYAGDDTPHGRMDAVARDVKALVKGPGSKNCVGFFTVPEKIGDNDLYYQFLLDLAWDPLAFDKKKFIRDYAVRRFGVASSENMTRSIENIVEAVYNVAPGDMNICYYKGLRGLGFFADNTSRSENERMALALRKAKCLRLGLENAFKETRRQKGNKLYENYIVEYGKHYLSELSNYHMISMYQGFKRGDRAAFESNAAKVETLLDSIETILASRPDYILQNTLTEVMKVPGTNPATPRMIRENMMVGDYVFNDNYEQMRVVYRPRLNAFIAEMRARLLRGDMDISWANCRNAFESITRDWLEKPLPHAPSRRGDVVETVQSLIRAQTAPLTEH